MDFPKEDTHVSNKHVGRYSLSLVVREMPLKTTMSCHFTTQEGHYQKDKKRPPVLASRGGGKPSCTVGRMQTGATTVEKNTGAARELRNSLQAAIPPLGVSLKEWRAGS